MVRSHPALRRAPWFLLGLALGLAAWIGLRLAARWLPPPPPPPTTFAAASAARPSAPALRLRARLLRTTPPPAAAEMAPYRDALAVAEYAVVEVLAGDYAPARVRVAHVAVADGRPQPLPLAPGEETTLALVPLAEAPAAEGLYLADALPVDWRLPLFLPAPPAP